MQNVVQVLRLPRKNATHLHTVAKGVRLPHKTDFRHLYQTRENVTKCHACHAKLALQPALTPSKRIGFATSPIDTARPEENPET